MRTQTIGHTSAYPEVQPQPQYNTHTYGLTKREYFAATALQGLLSQPPIDSNTFNDPELTARDAVECADALIKELNKKHTEEVGE